MSKNNFYITLPSNSSMEYYADNTLAKYTTKLHQRVILDSDDWEVALVEIQYPSLFETISAHDNNVWIQPYAVQEDGTLFAKQFVLPKGIYDNEETLAEKLTRELKNMVIKFHTNMNRFIIQYNKKDVENVLLSNDMAQLLGFAQPTVQNINGQFQPPVEATKYAISANEVTYNNVISVNEDEIMIAEAPYPPKLTHCSPSHLYIYTDIIEPNLVGDCIAPLLRIIKVEKQTTDTNISVSFTNPYYLPIMKREFDTIEINIRDDEGHLIPFVSGKLNVRLHFRRVKNGFSY